METVIESKELNENKSHRVRVLEVLQAYREKNEPCSLWTIITLTGLTKAQVIPMISRINKKHDLDRIGTGDDVEYIYHGLKADNENNKEVRPLVTVRYISMFILETHLNSLQKAL